MVNPVKASFMAHVKWAWYITGACFVKPDDAAAPEAIQYPVSMWFNVFGWFAWPVCLVLQCLRAMGDALLTAYLYVHGEHAIKLDDLKFSQWPWLGVLCFRSAEVRYAPPLPYRLGWLTWFAVGVPMMLASWCWGLVVVSLQDFIYGMHWGMVWACAGDKTWWRVAKGPVPWLGIFGLIPGGVVGFVLGAVIANAKTFVDALTANVLYLSAFSYNPDNLKPTRLTRGQFYGRWLYAFPGALVGVVIGWVVGILSYPVHAFLYGAALGAKVLYSALAYEEKKTDDEKPYRLHVPYQWGAPWQYEKRYGMWFFLIWPCIVGMIFGLIWSVAYSLFEGFTSGFDHLDGWLYSVEATNHYRIKNSAARHRDVLRNMIKSYDSYGTSKWSIQWGRVVFKLVFAGIMALVGACLRTLIYFLGNTLFDCLWLLAVSINLGLDRDWIKLSHTFFTGKLTLHYSKASTPLGNEMDHKHSSWLRVVLRTPGVLVGLLLGVPVGVTLWMLRALKDVVVFAMGLVASLLAPCFRLLFIHRLTYEPMGSTTGLHAHIDSQGRFKSDKSVTQDPWWRMFRMNFHFGQLSVAEQTVTEIDKLVASDVNAEVTVDGIIERLHYNSNWHHAFHSKYQIACQKAEIERVVGCYHDQNEKASEPKDQTPCQDAVKSGWAYAHSRLFESPPSEAYNGASGGDQTITL